MKVFLHILRTHLHYLAWSKPRFALYFLSIIVSSVLYSATPFFYKRFVDLIPTGDYDALLITLVGFVLIRFVASVYNSMTYFFGDLNIVPAMTTVRTKVVSHLHDLDFAYHTTKSTGGMISAIKRGDGAFYPLTHGMHKVVDVAVSFVIMSIVFSSIDSRFLGIVLITFVVTILSAKFVISKNINTRKEFNDVEDDVSALIVDNIINFETVKLFANEDWERRKLDNHFVNWRQKLYKHSYSWRYLDFTLATIIALSVFAILGLGLELQQAGSFTIGQFVLLLAFVSIFFPQLWELMMGFREIAKSYEDASKYYGILDNIIEITDPVYPIKLQNIKGEVKFVGVSFSYKEGKKDALKQFDLVIRSGQSVALVGRSGSGKTTLTKLLMRFYDIDKGRITIDGVDIKDMTKSQLRSYMGVVPQEPIMFNNTIAYNIGYGRSSATKKEITAAAKMANLHSFIMSLPKAYDTNVGERGIRLSGGQKQRLAIARMILSEPSIIIFDEATSQLDSENEKKIQDAFWKVSANKTTIIIAHRLSTAMRADKIVVMDKGKIIEEGSHTSLLANEASVYKKFWDLQTRVE